MTKNIRVLAGDTIGVDTMYKRCWKPSEADETISFLIKKGSTTKLLYCYLSIIHEYRTLPP